MDRQEYQASMFGEDGEKRPWKTVGDFLRRLPDRLAGRSGKKLPNSERAEAVEILLAFMGEAADSEAYGRRFKYWIGRTKHFRPHEIHDLVRLAKDGKNPRAMFNYLLKQELIRRGIIKQKP